MHRLFNIVRIKLFISIFVINFEVGFLKIKLQNWHLLKFFVSSVDSNSAADSPPPGDGEVKAAATS